MEIFRLFGAIQVNKAKAIADLKAVSAAGKLHGGKLQTIFRKIGTVAKVAFGIAAVAATGIFVLAIKKAADFQLGMAKVRAISGATKEEFEDLTAEAKRLGLVTAQTMTDIATGMEAFARAGFDAHEIIAAMGGAVALAESQVMDLGVAVEITAAVLNGMRLPASEAERVANALAAAASSSATTVESLGESLKYLAPAAADLNVPLEEVLSIIGKLGDAGLRGGIATRAFAVALNRMASPTEEATKVMEELDIAFFDAHGEFIGITETVAVLERALEGMTTEQKKAALGAMFTGVAVRTFSVLLGVGSEELATYQEELTGTTVAFDQQAEMLDTLKGQWQILKGSIELLLVTIGTDMMPILKSLVQDRLVPLVNSMSKWIEKMGGLKGIFAWFKGKVRDWAREHEPLISAFIRAKDAVVTLWNTVKEAFRSIIKSLGWGSDEADSFGADFESAFTIAVDIVTTLLGGITKFVKYLADHGSATAATILAIGAAFLAWKVGLIVTNIVLITTKVYALVTALGIIGTTLAVAGAIILAYNQKTGESADITRALTDETIELMELDWLGLRNDLLGIADAAGITEKDLFALTDALETAFLASIEAPDPATARKLYTQYANEILAVWEKKYPELITLRTKYIADLEALDKQAAADKTKLEEDTQAQVLETTQDYLGQRRDLTLTGIEFTTRTEKEATEEVEKIHEEHHEDEIEAEKTFWDDFLNIVKDSADEVGDVMGNLWKSLKSMAKSALGDTLNSIANHFRDSRRLAEEHSGRMLDIEQRYSQDAADLQSGRQTEFTDAETTYHRTVEDIETRYRRELQEITGDDTEERARIETRYRGDMEDALTTYARRREDIETDYTSEVLRQEKRREQALADEKEEYRDMQKSLWEVLGDIVRDLLTTLREELFVKAAGHAVEALAWSFIPPLFFANPQAIGHGAAAAALFAGGAGLAIAGFEKGAVFERPTLLPPSLVGEGGYKEAYLPLSPSVFGEIGKGIVNALTVPTPTPVLAGAGGNTIQVDMRGLYEGAVINVRDDLDPARMARENLDLLRSRLRSQGVDIK